MLTSTVLVISMPSAAAVVSEWNTFPFVAIYPNPVGINQDLVVTYQMDKVNPDAHGVSGGQHFKGFTVTITKPDGTTEIKGPYEASAISGGYFIYKPTSTGTYTFRASFAGQWVNGSYQLMNPFGEWLNVSAPLPYIREERWYKPSTSGIKEITVQAEPIPSYPGVPLPTDYWTRPINAENKGWWQIADNWLMQGYDYENRFFSGSPAFAPYTSAPDSAHVLWKKPIVFGGIIGGPYGDKTYYSGLSYEQFYTPMIINGRIIYVDHFAASSTGRSSYGTRCLDLYTGEEIWFIDNVVINLAQVLAYDSPNEHGGIPHLWSVYSQSEGVSLTWNRAPAPANQTWKMYDAFSGKEILTVTNVTASYTVPGPKGEVLSYTIDTNTNRYILWNSTRVFTGAGASAIGPTSVLDTYSPTAGIVHDGRRGIEWNVSIPDLPGAQSIAAVGEGIVLAGSQNSTVYPNLYVEVAYPAELNKDSAGNYPTSINHLWIRPENSIEAAYFRRTRNVGDGVYARFDEAKRQFHGYSLETGDEIWVTNPLPEGFGYFTFLMHIAYGKLYESGYDGYVRAYDVTDGSLVWEFPFGSAGYETPYGTWPTYNGFTLADHKVFQTNDDHSPDSVIWRGGKLWAINADNGDEVWSISGWFRHSAVADGLLTAFNTLDGQVYTFGKGPTAITVEAPPNAIVKGTSVMITGSVTDQSPGQKGTPCISEADMTAWMEYLHMQKTKPTNANGVPVVLTATNQNGNTQEIGTVTSDMYGNYGLMWSPPADGKYQIVAKFAGSVSYGSSAASTYLGVGVAPSGQPTSTPPPTGPTQPSASSTPPPPPHGAPPSMELLIAIAVVTIIAVVVVAAVVLRRRK